MTAKTNWEIKYYYQRKHLGHVVLSRYNVFILDLSCCIGSAQKIDRARKIVEKAKVKFSNKCLIFITDKEKNIIENW